MSRLSQSSPASLAGIVLENTGVPVSRCYQCGKCSAGCPNSAEMDVTPSTILRMLQSDVPALDDKVLRSDAIWMCITCEMCVSRCPMEVDLPKVMDCLRQESITRKKQNPKSKKIIAFHKSMLDSIFYTGRLYEAGLVADYKARSFSFLQDLTIAPVMYLKGKLNLFPKRIKDRSSIKEIFYKTIYRK